MTEAEQERARVVDLLRTIQKNRLRVGDSAGAWVVNFAITRIQDRDHLKGVE